ncbi:MAG: hypothetical protein EBS49_01935 [Verrucomicrobia bacterium]|nr:hypothetical protein [Verrucomicrobiota bacterium]
MYKIVIKFIDELKQQVSEKGIRIKINDAAINHLIEKGFDSKMGARPLQRVIDKEIKRPLSRMMLFGELKDGGSLVIGLDGSQITLTKRTRQSKVVEDEPLETITNEENQ